MKWHSILQRRMKAFTIEWWLNEEGEHNVCIRNQGLNVRSKQLSRVNFKDQCNIFVVFPFLLVHCCVKDLKPPPFQFNMCHSSFNMLHSFNFTVKIFHLFIQSSFSLFVLTFFLWPEWLQYYLTRFKLVP